MVGKASPHMHRITICSRERVSYVHRLFGSAIPITLATIIIIIIVVCGDDGVHSMARLCACVGCMDDSRSDDFVSSTVTPDDTRCIRRFYELAIRMR